MKSNIIIDTGPLVSYLNKKEQFHDWALRQWNNIELPLLTCEAVITEACFLLRDIYTGEDGVISLLNNGFIEIAFSLNEESIAIEELLKRYQSVPMSLADACLVRMTELLPRSELLTIDSDFTIYRRFRNQLIPVIMPDRE